MYKLQRGTIFTGILWVFGGYALFHSPVWGTGIGIGWILLSILLLIFSISLAILAGTTKSLRTRERVCWLALSGTASVFAILGIVIPIKLLIAAEQIQVLLRLNG